MEERKGRNKIIILIKCFINVEGAIEALSTLDLEVRFHPDHHHHLPARAAHTTNAKNEKEKEKDRDKPPHLKWEETIAIKVPPPSSFPRNIHGGLPK
jgi:hypothetical protein